eukprot:4247825-Pyramimonas_sp.AAC.1
MSPTRHIRLERLVEHLVQQLEDPVRRGKGHRVVVATDGVREERRALLLHQVAIRQLLDNELRHHPHPSQVPSQREVGPNA